MNLYMKTTIFKYGERYYIGKILKKKKINSYLIKVDFEIYTPDGYKSILKINKDNIVSINQIDEIIDNIYLNFLSDIIIDKNFDLSLAKNVDVLMKCFSKNDKLKEMYDYMIKNKNKWLYK